MKTKALVVHTTGIPSEVVRYVERPLTEMKPHLVKLEMKASPINPADLNIIEGKYPIEQNLPIVLGNEGVGVVREVGANVQGLEEGQVVIPLTRPGNWCEKRVMDGKEVFPIPSSLPFEQAAMLLVNPPTAWQMLHYFVSLHPGEWLVQNAANSAVGRYVIHFADQLGYRTVNIVRRKELIQPLMDEGATVVLTEEEATAAAIREITHGESLKLGLNAVGGPIATEMAKSLSRHGTLVTYGAMSKKPLEIPNALQIFQGLRFCGFWLKDWFEQAPPEDIEPMFRQILEIVQNRRIHIPVEKTYRLEEWAEALAHAERGGRDGKVLFVMN